MLFLLEDAALLGLWGVDGLDERDGPDGLDVVDRLAKASVCYPPNRFDNRSLARFHLPAIIHVGKTLIVVVIAVAVKSNQQLHEPSSGPQETRAKFVPFAILVPRSSYIPLV